ncbi:MAG: tyrosine-type recombinase/integrase, partial [Terrimicrobiaceae bacterium]|nr:tyrosine-type recombinase/integrase [Terrimicrobiaceae bacterium]
LGTGGYELSPAQLGEAIACFRQIEGTGLSLSEAVKLSLKSYRPKTASISLADAIQGFLSAQKDRGAADKTIIGYQSFLRLLAEGLSPKINVHEITDKEVRKHLAKYERPASRNATIRHLRAFFRWTSKRGWREGDPTEQIDKTREIDEAVSILTVPQARKLLVACATDAECQPLLASTAIGLFAGLRTAELATLNWEDVHLTGSQRFIEVTARKAKTRQRRIVSISDNLAAWLMPVARSTGPVVPTAYRERHEHLQKLANLTPWPRNVLRHSFGSYHLAFHKNEALTAAEMGNSPTVIFQHYRALVTPEAAEKFWKLLPVSGIDADKVVEFVA